MRAAYGAKADALKSSSENLTPETEVTECPTDPVRHAASQDSVLEIEMHQNPETAKERRASEKSSARSSFEAIMLPAKRIRSVVRPASTSARWQVRCAFFRHHLGEILNSQRFDTMLGVIIIANAVNIGLELSWRAQGQDTTICNVLEHCFLAIYTIELAMRMLLDWHVVLTDVWVRFDIFLVSLGIVSQWILDPFFSDVAEVHTLLMLRCARLLRLAKTVRFLMRFKELWMLVQGLANSAYTMVYTILLLFVVLYIFACLALQLLYQHPMIEQDEIFAKTVQENFSDLASAMVTLLQFVSFDNIVHVYKPLGDRDPLLLAYFVVVILVVGITIMNLVTAVIVNSSLEQVAKDKSLLQTIEEQNRKKVLADLRAMFYRMDYDGSGEVSREEICRIPPHERQVLRELTGFDDPLELFDALDTDEKGEIGIEEFCDGLWEVAVSDSPLEIKRMQKQVEHIKHHLSSYISDTEHIKSVLKELLTTTQKMESGMNSMNSSVSPSWFLGQAQEDFNMRRVPSNPVRPDVEGDTPIAPVPGRRRSITSKAADVARRLVKPFGGGSHARPEEEVPLWALRLSHDVHELRHITENVVVAALGELMPQTSSEVRRRSLQPALIREEEDEDLDSSHSSSFRDPGSRPWTNPFEESSHSRGGNEDQSVMTPSSPMLEPILQPSPMQVEPDGAPLAKERTIVPV